MRGQSHPAQPRMARLRAGVGGLLVLGGMIVLVPSSIRGQAAGPSAAKPRSSSEEAEPDQADREAYPLRLTVKLGRGSILVKAPKGVRPAALRVAREKIETILADADPAIVERLGASHLAVIIAPLMGRFTDLPDVHDLAETRNAFDQPLDLARGVFRTADPPSSKSKRPTRHSPLIAVGEEDILRIVPCGPHSAFHHELAHAVHSLGLSTEQRSEWRDAFAQARKRGLFKNRYAALNEDEFFAELSQAYFDVAPYFCSSDQLARVDRSAFDQLARIYSSRRLERESAPPPRRRK